MDNLRRELLELRRSVENREEKEKAMAEKLLPFFEGKKTAGLYMPAGGEADVLRFLPEDLLFAAPAVLNGTEMEFRVLKNLQPGAFGILEPEQTAPVDPEDLDLILVPLVGFHETFRLGHGAGYFDRYLKKTDALKIGLAFDEQEADFPVQPWDEQLDVLITPARIFRKEK